MKLKYNINKTINKYTNMVMLIGDVLNHIKKFLSLILMSCKCDRILSDCVKNMNGE